MWQYRIIEMGFFHADGGAMFGAIPKKAWNRKYPSNENNCCVLSMNCLLVWNGDRVILFDTGVGTKDLGKLSYYCFSELKDISEVVRSNGFEPEEITDVVLSHLHFDHCGGCTYLDEKSNLKVTFPNAIHWVGETQWENYLNPNPLEKASYRKTDLMPVFGSNLLKLVQSDIELYPGLQISLFDGHSSGQLVSIIESEDEQILFLSDTIPTKAHFSNEWISAYDISPLDSLNAKMKIKKLIEKKNTRIVFYHDAYQKSFRYPIK